MIPVRACSVSVYTKYVSKFSASTQTNTINHVLVTFFDYVESPIGKFGRAHLPNPSFNLLLVIGIHLVILTGE